MISTKIIKAKGFWKTVVVFTTIFIVVMNLIRIGMVYGFDFSAFYEQVISGKLFMFFVSNVLIWFVLGFVLTYFNFKKAMEKNEEK